MRIMILGAAGFVGQHLVRYARNLGHESISVDRCWPSDTYGRADFIQADLSLADCSTQLLKLNPDAIVNLAAESFVHDSGHRSSEHFDSNVVVPMRLADAFAQSKHKPHLVHVSTCEVYGDTLSGPALENSTVLPLSVYAGTKLAGESIVGACARSHLLKATVLRPFNLYGPGQQSNRLIPRIESSLRRQQPITIDGGGLQTRDWHHVEDFCELVFRILESPAPSEGEPRIVNSCSGESRSVLSVVQEIQSRSRLPLELQLSSHLPQQPQIRLSSGSYRLAEELYGWAPRVSFQEGLEELLGGWAW